MLFVEKCGYTIWLSPSVPTYLWDDQWVSFNPTYKYIRINIDNSPLCIASFNFSNNKIIAPVVVFYSLTGTRLVVSGLPKWIISAVKDMAKQYQDMKHFNNRWDHFKETISDLGRFLKKEIF